MSRRTSKAQASAAPAQGRAAAGLDWGHLRFFLELVRTGSHSSAAQRLGVDRNTVARRVAALEEELGVALFERGPQGWSCTAADGDLRRTPRVRAVIEWVDELVERVRPALAEQP